MLIDRRTTLGLAGFLSLSQGTAQADPAKPAQGRAVETTVVAAKNEQVIRRHHALLDAGDINAAVRFYAEDTRNHGRPVGRQGVRTVLSDILTTFPDWRMEIVELAAVGDVAIVRMNVSGTHKGVGRIPVNGGLLVGVPATGRAFKVQHIHWYSLTDGLITEHYANRDDLGMMQQLGLLPLHP